MWEIIAAAFASLALIGGTWCVASWRSDKKKFITYQRFERLFDKYEGRIVDDVGILIDDLRGALKRTVVDINHANQQKEKTLTMYAGKTAPVSLPAEETVSLAVQSAQNENKTVVILVDQLSDVRGLLEAVEKTVWSHELSRICRAAGDVRVEFLGGGKILFAVLAPPRAVPHDLSIRVDWER